MFGGAGALLASKDKSKEPADAVKQLADKTREKKGVQWGVAKLDSRGETKYVEFFRGKDFARYIRANPEKLEPVSHLLKTSSAGRAIDDQISDLIQLFAKRGFITKTERKFKKPKPGKKRLVKFPKTLELSRDQGWSEDAFYAWNFERPTSIWYYMGAVALPVCVIAACLFPLAPHIIRMYTLYAMMTLLSTILVLIAVRYALFTVVWVATGRFLWLFPNLLADDVPVMEAFRPVISMNTPTKSQIASRAASALVLATCTYLLCKHSPDRDSLSSGAQKAHDSILEFLDLHRGRAGIAGSVDPTLTADAARKAHTSASASGHASSATA